VQKVRASVDEAFGVNVVGALEAKSVIEGWLLGSPLIIRV
jgi:hypothetical protein